MRWIEAQLSGSLIQPEDTIYDEARCLWNGMFDKRPAAIAKLSARRSYLIPLFTIQKMLS
jgi:hypothetical protein